VKERHWNSVVAALRHGQCTLVLGPEIPVSIASTGSNTTADHNASFVEALRRELARELEDDNRRICGNTLAALAQQYEDAEGFGPGTLRATAERFFRSRAYRPSAVHEKLASLPSR
jgi:hypothetical protein